MAPRYRVWVAVAIAVTTLLTGPSTHAFADAAPTAPQNLPATPGPLASQCPAPAWRGTIPAAGAATREQMLEAQKEVARFNTAVNGYTKCLATVHDRLAANPKLSKGELEALGQEHVRLNNAAIGEVERIVGAFNTQLRAWQHEPVPPVVAAGNQPGTTPPHLLRTPSADDLGSCYSGIALQDGEQARIVATVTIAADGSVTAVELPAGTSRHMAKAARCVVARVTFSPGTKDGKPVTSRATLPLDFQFKDSALTGPVLSSTPAELAALRESCYPAGFKGDGQVTLKAKISTKGRTRSISIVKSGGSKQVDRIAECMLRGARYQPATAGQTGPVEVVITLTIPVHS